MRQTALSQSGSPGRIIGRTNFADTSIQYVDFSEIFNVSLDLSAMYFAQFSG